MNAVVPTLRSRGRLAASLLAVLALAVPAPAQLRAARLTLDNDAFAFWMPYHTRPDYEYTNGVDLSVEFAGGPGWARRLSFGADACTGSEAPDAACSTTTVAFGQQIYAPREDGEELEPGNRPYAGWLYLSATSRVASAGRRRSLGVEVGVTGQPSLAEAVHTGWHHAAGFWSPRGWHNQIAFEPGVVLRYDQAWLGEAATDEGRRIVAVAPEVGAALGNVLTAAHAGVRASAGLDVPHPWSPAADRGSGSLSVYALAAARGDAVARNLFLDGSTFGGGPRVEHEPLVLSYEVGGGVRYRNFTVEYRAHHRGREYRTEPGGHTYATIELTWRATTPPMSPPLGAAPLPPGSHGPDN